MATQTHQKPANPSTTSTSAHGSPGQATNGSTVAKKGPKSDEEKHATGKQLAYIRVNKVLTMLDKIGNLGRYNLTDEEKTKIVNAVTQRFETMKANISQKMVKKEGFTL